METPELSKRLLYATAFQLYIIGLDYYRALPEKEKVLYRESIEKLLDVQYRRTASLLEEYSKEEAAKFSEFLKNKFSIND